jgi:hypothetical protein
MKKIALALALALLTGLAGFNLPNYQPKDC